VFNSLKQVSAAEYHPIERIKTNVRGAQNVIQSALDMDIIKRLCGDC
jgi:FlaA1/EpsC-like NDP-sugar epimerase